MSLNLGWLEWHIFKSWWVLVIVGGQPNLLLGWLAVNQISPGLQIFLLKELWQEMTLS